MKNISTKFPAGIFHIVKSRFTDVHFPYAVQFNITFKCNQRCVYCGIYNEERKEMTTKEIFRMLDQFADMGTSRLSITGGEPLLRKDLPDVVNYARKKGLFVSVATNGTLLPEKLTSLLNVNSFNLTLDGPEEIHDKQRGEGSFQKVVESVKFIQEKGITVYVNCVLTKNNCNRLDEILDIGRELQVKLLLQPVFFAEESHANNREGYDENKYNDDEMFQTLKRLIELKKNKDPQIMLSRRYYEMLKDSIKTEKTVLCNTGGKLFCTISSDGKVGPCNLLATDNRWLNGNEVGFQKAFMNMPEIGCGGCISSFIDIDYLFSLKPDVVLNYLRQ